MLRNRPAPTVATTRRVAVGADRLWQVIATPGSLERCHPFCERNPVERWPGPDARDAIHYYGGRVLGRRFTAWLEGSGYDLVVVDAAGIEQASVRWRIEPESRDACRLTVSLHLSFLERLPTGLRRFAYRLVARRRMRCYLEAVLAGVAHHAETGEPVRRNQFGAHPWFSPSV